MDTVFKLIPKHRPISICFKRPYIKDTYYEVALRDGPLGLVFKGSNVSAVKPDLWANQCGIEVGDQICIVDGEDFISASAYVRVELLKRPSGTIVELKRPAEHKTKAAEERRSNRESVT